MIVKVPRVINSEGTFVRVAKMPLISPTTTPRLSAASMPISIGSPYVPEISAVVIAPAGIIAPNEMSISPAIIRRPTGSATMPRLAAKFSQLAAAPSAKMSARPTMT